LPLPCRIPVNDQEHVHSPAFAGHERPLGQRLFSRQKPHSHARAFGVDAPGGRTRAKALCASPANAYTGSNGVCRLLQVGRFDVRGNRRGVSVRAERVCHPCWVKKLV